MTWGLWGVHTGSHDNPQPAPRYLYHNTSAENRDSIARHGLLPEYDQSVLQGEDPEYGGAYASDTHRPDSRGGDTWVIDTARLPRPPETDWTTDPEDENWYFIPGGVPPHALTLHRPGPSERTAASWSPSQDDDGLEMLDHPSGLKAFTFPGVGGDHHWHVMTPSGAGLARGRSSTSQEAQSAALGIMENPPRPYRYKPDDLEFGLYPGESFGGGAAGVWSKGDFHGPENWLSGITWGSDGEIGHVETKPEHQRRGLATQLFDYVKQHHRPDLRHSPTLSDDGRAWSQYEQSRHAQRTAMPWYHNTDAELNPGDMLLPAAERGHNSRWRGTEDEPYPHYDPHSVYMYNEHGNPNFYQGYGKNRYEVEPIGPIQRDPEWDLNRRQHAEWIAQDEGINADDAYDLFDDEDVDGFADHTAPRARVVRKLNRRTAMPYDDYARFLPDIHRIRDGIVADGETNSTGGPSCGVTAEEVAEMLRGQGVAASENYGAFYHPDGGTPEHTWVNLPGGHILDPTADQFGYEPVRLLHPGHPDHARYLNRGGDDDHHTAARTAMPWYHNTDAELNPGDMLLPAAERGHDSRWKNLPEYDPNLVYFTKEDSDENAEYWRGRHRYEVEPIGQIERDPEHFHHVNVFEEEHDIPWDENLDLDEYPEARGVDVMQNSYVAPRARVVRKLPPHPFWETPENRNKEARIMSAAVTVYTQDEVE